MKKEELKEVKKDVEKKTNEVSDDELDQVSGGRGGTNGTKYNAQRDNTKLDKQR